MKKKELYEKPEILTEDTEPTAFGQGSYGFIQVASPLFGLCEGCDYDCKFLWKQ